MSARPFQVGDRVRITMHRTAAPDEIAEGRVTELERISPSSPITMWVRRDVPDTYEDGTPRLIAAVYVTDDQTGPAFPLTYTVELLEPASDMEWVIGADGEPVDAREVISPSEDDGTEAESLAEVQAPWAPAFPDVLAHGRTRSLA